MARILTSLELNLLIHRYLQDSGFEHSVFMFGKEADVSKCPIDGILVPPGALVKLVQKGLMYLEMEANLIDPDSDTDEDFSFLQPMDLITKSVDEIQQIMKDRREEKSGNKVLKKPVVIPKKVRSSLRQERQKPQQKQKERKMFLHAPVAPQYLGDSSPMVLKGHSSEVLCCAWSPRGSILASGSGDGTARIWTVACETNRSSNDDGSSNMVILNHGGDQANAKTKDVTSLDWNGDGTLLATGSFDGHARIWSISGELKSTIGKHEGPIISLKWNKRGDYILTGSADNSAIVWDVKAQMMRQIEINAGPVIDWKDDISFATCSEDHKIHVCKIGRRKPIRSFSGHKGIVNCIAWDPTGSLLASCSDDTTAKIWNMTQEEPLLDLKGHSKEIYIVRWRPAGPGTENLNQPSILASASFDSTVKVWDVNQGTVLYNLDSHSASVYGLAFSPDGEYLATGSMDKSMHIWSVKHQKIVKQYTGNGMIFEVSWNRNGDQVAACFSDNVVCIVDL